MQALGDWCKQIIGSWLAPPDNLYVLQLCEGKYYIGESSNIPERVKDHFAGRGAAWTSKYPPVRLLRTLYGNEDTITLEYMRIHGIENVRGGSYCTVQLPQHTVDLITRQIRTAESACYHCGERGHFIRQCPDRACARCGHSSHTADQCFATTHKDGHRLKY